MRITWSTRPAAGWELVPVAPYVVMYAPFVVKADIDGLDFDVELEIGALPADGDRAGRAVCRELRVRQREGGPAVNGEALRSVPVAYLTQRGAQEMARSTDPAVWPMAKGGVPLHKIHHDKMLMLKQQGPTEELLVNAAYLYRLATVTGYGPRLAIEEAFEVSRSTAGRWIALARERGHLGPVEGPGKAGG